MVVWETSDRWPAVYGCIEPVAVVEDVEGVDGDGGHHEQQVEHRQRHQQPVEGVLPQLVAGEYEEFYHVK